MGVGLAVAAGAGLATAVGVDVCAGVGGVLVAVSAPGPSGRSRCARFSITICGKAVPAPFDGGVISAIFCLVLGIFAFICSSVNYTTARVVLSTLNSTARFSQMEIITAYGKSCILIKVCEYQMR